MRYQLSNALQHQGNTQRHRDHRKCQQTFAVELNTLDQLRILFG
jgi:hypothetical protein